MYAEEHCTTTYYYYIHEIFTWKESFPRHFDVYCTDGAMGGTHTSPLPPLPLFKNFRHKLLVCSLGYLDSGDLLRGLIFIEPLEVRDIELPKGPPMPWPQQFQMRFPR